MKIDELLDRNYPKGTEGEQMNVVLSCISHNLRIILNRLSNFYIMFLCQQIAVATARILSCSRLLFATGQQLEKSITA